MKYIEREVEDYFEMDWISKKESNLPYDFFVTMNDGVNETPYIYCRRNEKDMSDAIVVSISSNPVVLKNSFKNEEEREQVISFIQTNKDLFIDYWNMKCSTNRFFDDIKGIVDENI